MDESRLEEAQQHVVEAEERVKVQTARVADLARRGQDQTQARVTLAVFEETLRLMREDLIREQQRAAGKKP